MNLGMESETLEFKKSTSELDEGIISLVSMLNKYGEKAFYISDNTIIVTIPINKELLEKVDSKNDDKGLSETEQKVYNYIKENEHITISELSDKIAVGERQIMRILNNLKDKNIIKREGSNKNGVWKIIGE